MNSRLFDLVSFIRNLYPNESPVPLHAPRFLGNEKQYLGECIDSTYVSYVGPFVSRFEDLIKELTGSQYAIAMVNGTAALQMALISCGLKPGDEVITQALTFAATANGIRHAGAEPVFVDVDLDTLGMSPEALRMFLESNSERRSDGCYDKRTGRRIFGVLPMHTFGFCARIEAIGSICAEWDLTLIEDSAESLGSFVGSRHTGTFGRAAILSFNGNKPVTTGGGGMLLTDDEVVAQKARHISTTAKRKHRWEFFHDELGWNLRMPNINAAVGCAQMERIAGTLHNKRETARLYADWGVKNGFAFVQELPETSANYWLNAIVLADRVERDEFLRYSNDSGIQTRPIWVLMNRLPMYQDCFRGPLANSEWLEDRVVNLPSSIRI